MKKNVKMGAFTVRTIIIAAKSEISKYRNESLIFRGAAKK